MGVIDRVEWKPERLRPTLANRLPAKPVRDSRRRNLVAGARPADRTRVETIEEGFPHRSYFAGYRRTILRRDSLGDRSFSRHRKIAHRPRTRDVARDNTSRRKSIGFREPPLIVSAFFDAQRRWVGEYDGTKSRSATDFGSLNCALTMSDGFRITTPQP